MTDIELGAALTGKEVQRLADYERREQANETLIFAAQVCGWPPEADALHSRRALSDGERQDQRTLQARRDWKAHKATYKAGLEARIFGPLPDYVPFLNTMSGSNLPALIAQYERERQWRTTPASRREHGEKFLSEIVSTNLRECFDRYGEKQGQMGAILDDAVCRLVGGINEYVTNSLALDEPAPAVALAAPPKPAPVLAPADPFPPLLLNYTLAELTALLGELGLLDTATGRPTPAASPGAWVGVVHALLHPGRPRLRPNMAAVGRALKVVFGAQVSESALQAGTGRKGGESEQVKGRTLALLAARPAGD